ncbi:MAG: thermonuclease family protein [Candidatus Jettenia sp.]|nr:thermonuclease family protein [Candidatus Jettenia sp.]
MAFAFSIHGERFRGSTYAENKDLATEYTKKFYNALYLDKFQIQKENVQESDFLETHIGERKQEEIVKAGYATPMTIPPNVKYSEQFSKTFREARKKRKGLWK